MAKHAEYARATADAVVGAVETAADLARFPFVFF